MQFIEVSFLKSSFRFEVYGEIPLFYSFAVENCRGVAQ